MNNRKKKIIYAAVAALVACSVAVSCSDPSGEHYRVSEDAAGRVTLWELISQQPELSTFAGWLKQVDYDVILSGEQAYTVWAPENDALAGISPNDTEAVLRLVTNHIARYTNPTSTTETHAQILYMESAKRLLFSRNGDNYAMGGAELAQKNRTAKNGILHTLKQPIAFEPSIWQYMEEAGYDSIRSYLYSFNKREFIRSVSKQIDYNDEGMIVYDSVFLNQNVLWYVYRGAKGIGWLNNEDSLYTMILPNNKAWKEVYDRTYDYFKPDPEVDNPDSMQVANTRYSIVQDLVFRGAVNPASYNAGDTLFSTRNAPFLNPTHLFSGLTSLPVSNGWVYPASRLNYELHESAIKPVLVETENALGRWHNSAEDFSTIYSYFARDIPNVSKNAYLFVRATYTGAAPSVSFELPDVLAAEYDIYCVCLAQSYVETIRDTTQWYVTRLRFEIQQWDRLGKKEENKSWRTIATFTEPASSPKYVTQREGISKILVTEKFKFPFANINEPDNVFRLKVFSALDRSDPPALFKNEMRIDYILLEASR